MTLLAGDIYSEARIFLNDASGTLYTDTVILPFMKRARDELMMILAQNEAGLVQEISSPIAITAGVLSVPMPAPAAGRSGGFEVTDILVPTKVVERAQGASNDLFLEMEEKSWEPDEIKSTTLRYWVWRGDGIQLLGATTNREVKIYYTRIIIPIITSFATIEPQLAKCYLSARLASMLAGFLGENLPRAKLLNDEANIWLRKLLAITTKNRQGLPARRRPYRAFGG
jgi:hypothetical protein